MKVMFGYSGGFDRITSVYWEDDGVVRKRQMAEDGTSDEFDTRFGSLREAFDELYGSLNPFYVTEVDDVRSAFKYLGKASDLVETLPEAELDDAEQPLG